MKKFVFLCLLLLICISFTLPASATTDNTYNENRKTLDNSSVIIRENVINQISFGNIDKNADITKLKIDNAITGKDFVIAIYSNDALCEVRTIIDASVKEGYIDVMAEASLDADAVKFFIFENFGNLEPYTVPITSVFFGDTVGELSYIADPEGYQRYIVDGIGDFKGSHLIIPETYNGWPVTKISANAFSNCSQLKSVVIPHTVKTIGDYAFSNCKKLTSAEVRTYQCGYQENGYAIFSGCSAITDFHVNDLELCIKTPYTNTGWHDYYPFGFWFGTSYYSGGIANVMHYWDMNTATIKDKTFYLPQNLETVHIGGYGMESYTGWGYTEVFAGCTSIKKIVLEEGLSYIPNELFYSFTGLEEVVLPKSIKKIGSYSFAHCNNILITYGGTAEDWNNIEFASDWDYSTRDYVIKCTDKTLTKDSLFWGYDEKEHTYSFVTNCELVVDSITSDEKIALPELKRDNYHFVGWYTDKECSGEGLFGDFYRTSDVVFYAKWMTDSEYTEYCDGSSFERAIHVDVGTTKVTHRSGGLYFVFVPTESKSYTFESSGASSSDSYAYLYDTSKIFLEGDDDSGSGNNFYFTVELIKAQKYYIRVGLYDPDGIETYSLIIK